MANLRGVIKKALGKAATLAGSLEQAPSSYTPTSKIALVRQRIEDSIVALTPDIAPSVSFAAVSGYVGADVAFDGYWRKVDVHYPSAVDGALARNTSLASYRATVAIDIGYPAQPVVEVTESGSPLFLSVPDVRSSDLAQIDALMFGSDLFNSPTSLTNCTVIRLRQWAELNATVWRGTYEIEISEAI